MGARSLLVNTALFADRNADLPGALVVARGAGFYAGRCSRCGWVGRVVPLMVAAADCKHHREVCR